MYTGLTEADVAYWEQTFNPAFWAWTYEDEFGVPVQEVPAWWQDWYSGAHWSQPTGAFMCKQEEAQNWAYWQEAVANEDEEKAKPNDIEDEVKLGRVGNHGWAARGPGC